MYAVVTAYTFDTETKVVEFKDNEYEKAKAYLKWLYEKQLAEEKGNGAEINPDETFHHEGYARVEWADGCATEYTLSTITDADPGFRYEGIKKYHVGEKYWFRNEIAGPNKQSCGKLSEVDKFGNYVMFNERYGYITVTKDNLDSHN